jgi:hypothetical protein
MDLKKLALWAGLIVLGAMAHNKILSLPGLSKLPTF